MAATSAARSRSPRDAADHSVGRSPSPKRVRTTSPPAWTPGTATALDAPRPRASAEHVAASQRAAAPVKTAQKKNKGKDKKAGKRKTTSSEDALFFNIRELLDSAQFEKLTSPDAPRDGWAQSGWDLSTKATESPHLVVTIQALSSFGDGLAVSPRHNWVLAVPFTVPGDRVKVKVYRHAELCSWAEMVEVEEAGPWRDNSRISCKYYGKCSGCQYQMLSYDKQLEIKQTVVEKAFRHFSGLDAKLIPAVRPTLPSPLPYGYRTKLTPHFEPPRGVDKNGDPQQLRIGFEEKGRRKVMDIEECPLATKVINDKLVQERQKIRDTISQYKRGSTLLLRDSFQPATPGAPLLPVSPAEDVHACVTDHKSLIYERVGGLTFRQKAGDFFQNNSSILPPLLSYVSEQLPPASGGGGPRYLIDTYCGSGLFALSLAGHFTAVKGIEISESSIVWARENAAANGVSNASFVAGSAEKIFDGVEWPADRTTVAVDPPRAGCSQDFLQQLLAFGPQSVLYVSCNVHTQARDCGVLAGPRDDGSAAYRIESIRGADLFPQSHHCESIAVLRRSDLADDGA